MSKIKFNLLYTGIWTFITSIACLTNSTYILLEFTLFAFLVILLLVLATTYSNSIDYYIERSNNIKIKKITRATFESLKGFTLSILFINLLGLFVFLFSKRIHLEPDYLGFFESYQPKMLLEYSLNLVYWNHVHIAGFGMLIFSKFTFLWKMILLLSFLLILPFAAELTNRRSARVLEQPILMGFGLLFSLILISTNDFMSIYISLEGLTFISCTLIITSKLQPVTVNSALRYYVIGSISSGVLIWAIAWLYGIVRETNFSHIIFPIYENLDFYSFINSLIFPFFIIIMCILVKLGVFPFNIWLFQVYQDLSFLIIFYLAIIVNPTLLILLLKIIAKFKIYIYYLNPFLIFMSLGCLIISSIGIYEEKKIREFIIYSSLNQISFLLLCLANIINDNSSITCFIFFLIINIFNSIVFFSGLLNVEIRQSYNVKLNILEDLKGISENTYLSAVLITSGLISFLGLPCSLGFFSKFSIYKVTIGSGWTLFFIVSSFISSTVIAKAYLSVLEYIWFFEEKNQISKNEYNVILKKGGMYTNIHKFFIFFIFFSFIWFNDIINCLSFLNDLEQI